MNEFLSLLVLQENITQEGLRELVLSSWGHYSGVEKHFVEPLDDSVMQSLLSKCRVLSTLRLNSMMFLPDHVRKCLAERMSSILTSNSQIKHLEIDSFSGDQKD